MKSLFDELEEIGCEVEELIPFTGDGELSPLFNLDGVSEEKLQKAWERKSKSFMEKVMAKARREGFEKGMREGFEKGYREGLEAAKTKVEEVLSRLETLLNSISEAKDRVFEAIADELLDFAIAFSEKIVKKSISGDREVVLRNMREALSKLTLFRSVVVRVNPEDLELVKSFGPSILREFSTHSKLSVEPDDDVERGGCIVETEFGKADARIGSQIKRLRECVFYVEGKSSSENRGC